jgi:hypothetical protein
MDALLDLRALEAQRVASAATPFPFFVVEDTLPRDAQTVAALYADFPHYRSAGFFPYAGEDCGASVRRVVEQMTSRDFGDAVGRCLGIDGLGEKPTLATLCRSLNLRHGTIHTDSRSKIVTALLYLNETWPDTSGGCLRFLGRIDDIEALSRRR